MNTPPIIMRDCPINYRSILVNLFKYVFVFSFMRFFVVLLFLIFLVAVAFAQPAQEPELRLRYHSTTQNVTIDLSEYLPGDAFVVGPTTHVRVFLNGSFATLVSEEGWRGVEEIVFRVHSLEAVHPQESIIVESTSLSFKPPRLFSEDMFGADLSEILLSSYRRIPLEGVASGIYEDNLFVVLNNNTQLLLPLFQASPSATLNISLGSGRRPVVISPSFDIRYFFFLPLIVLSFVAALFLLNPFVFRRLPVSFEVQAARAEFLADLTSLLRRRGISERTAHPFLSKGFSLFFGVNSRSSSLELLEILRRQGVGGDLRQRIIFMFEHSLRSQRLPGSPKENLVELSEILRHVYALSHPG